MYMYEVGTLYSKIKKHYIPTVYIAHFVTKLANTVAANIPPHIHVQ